MAASRRAGEYAGTSCWPKAGEFTLAGLFGYSVISRQSLVLGHSLQSIFDLTHADD